MIGPWLGMYLVTQYWGPTTNRFIVGINEEVGAIVNHLVAGYGGLVMLLA